MLVARVPILVTRKIPSRLDTFQHDTTFVRQMRLYVKVCRAEITTRFVTPSMCYDTVQCAPRKNVRTGWDHQLQS